MTTLDELRALLSEATQRPWQTKNIPYNKLDDPCIFSGATGQYVCQLVYDQQSITQRPEVDADAALIVAAINALPELLDRVERLEADMQVIAFGSRIVANADNTLSHVDWTREQLVEFARAALAKDATT